MIIPSFKRETGYAYVAFLLLNIGTFSVSAQTTPNATTPTSPAAALDLEQVPWGIGSSASSTGTYSEWFPKLSAAGVHWTRMFPEWSGIEKSQGNYDFAWADAMLDSAKANGMEVSGLIFGKCPWGPGGMHSFPMQNLDDWTDYAAKISDHYKGRIHYWEIWNEGNAGFNDGHNNTGDYANLVAAAYAGVKKSDPTALVGMSVASYDPAYLDQAIVDQAQSGKAGSFDYFCIHPYETFGLIGDVDGEISYLWMARMLRDELKADAPPDKVNAPIWITEVGRPLDRTTNESGVALGQDVHEVDAAKAMVKAYVMAIAQGIARVCWFEAQDPHGEPGGYGLLDINGKPRLSYVAMKAMTGALGEMPKYEGWLALGAGNRSYGFVFQDGASSGMALWMPATLTDNITFPGDVNIVDPLTGKSSALKAGQPLALTDAPVFITGLPAEVVAQAKTNANKNFPWGGDYSGATAVSYQPGPKPVSNGVMLQGKGVPHTFDDGSTGIQVEGKIGTGANFYTHPSFASIRNKEYYIRISFRRLGPGNVGMNFSYEVADSEGQGPLRHNGGWYSVGPDMGWQTQTWHVTDACFAKMWGFDFCLQPEQSVPFVVGKVEVSTVPFTK